MARTVRMGPGSEFDLIRKFVEDGGPWPSDVMIGPGDDAAVFRGGWVVSTDLSVEDVHFRRAWLEDREIGYRAAVAGLSDLAAMAAEPVALLLSVAAPRGGSVDLEAINEGVRVAAEAHGAAVVGGDVSRSPGPLFLDITAVGCTAWPVQRDGAEPGDHVWVTGSLGASAAALRIWTGGETPPAGLRTAYARPVARVAEARCLVEREVVDAMIDVSDGLVGDAGHLAAASGVSITLELGQVPVAPAAVEALGQTEALAAALHGGEDYELCFVTDPGVVDESELLERFGLAVTRVGRVDEGDGIWLEDADGTKARPDRGGYDHFGTRGG